MVTLPPYLLSIEMERLLVIVGSEEEEEKMEAGELSFAESEKQIGTLSRMRHHSHLGGFSILQIDTSNVCFLFRCFVYIYVATVCNTNWIIKL